MGTIELRTKASPSEMFRALGERPDAAWLDDGTFVEPTFMACSPAAQLIVPADGRPLLRSRDGAAEPLDRAPLDAIARFAAETPAGPIPWTVGYLGYDLARHVEACCRPRPCEDGDPLPLAVLSRYDAVLCGRAEARSLGRAGGGEEPRLSWTIHGRDDAAAERLLAAWREGRARAKAGARLENPPSALLDSPCPERHELALRRALEYIAAGDVYQVNLAGRFRIASAATPEEVYLRMRRLQPVPHGAFLRAGDVALLVNSPERFLRVRAGAIETRPIKGTRPRGRTPAEDRAEIRALTRDPKELAEHVMIVDLARNDLGRVCLPTTVHVSSLLAVESFATIHHLVSTVRGRLRPGTDLADLLRATFPGGSITGAPKLRAIEIIAELEEHAREVYTGAIVRFTGPLELDSAIAIRVAVARNGVFTYHAGGGIVADSIPERELAECRLKAAPFLRALLGRDAPGAQARPHLGWKAAG